MTEKKQIDNIEKKIDEITSIIENKDKPGFFKKWFSKADSYVESKLGTEEENDLLKRQWTSWKDIASMFENEDLHSEFFTGLKCAFEVMNRLEKDSFIRESATLHNGKIDKKFRSTFIDIRDLFDRLVDCAYVYSHTDNEDIKDKSIKLSEDIRNLIFLYEQTVLNLVIKRLSNDNSKRKDIASCISFWNKTD
jgi:hypothetical protein